VGPSVRRVRVGRALIDVDPRWHPTRGMCSPDEVSSAVYALALAWNLVSRSPTSPPNPISGPIFWETIMASIQWRVYSRSGRSGQAWQLAHLGTFDTKREAVAECMARRAEKTPIYRAGRDYNILLPKA